MEQKIQTVLKITPKAKNLFKRLAQADGRTLSGELTWLVDRELTRRRAARSAKRSEQE